MKAKQKTKQKWSLFLIGFKKNRSTACSSISGPPFPATSH